MDAILKVSLIKINGITLSNNIYYLNIYIEYFIPYFIQFYSWKLCLPIRSLYYKNIFSKLVNTCCNFSSEYESNVWKCLKDLHVLPNIFFLLFKHISKYNYIIIFDSGLKFVEWLNNWIGKIPVVEKKMCSFTCTRIAIPFIANAQSLFPLYEYLLWGIRAWLQPWLE